MALEIRRRRVGSGDLAIEIIEVIGRLDTPGGSQLRASVQEALKEGTPKVALDLTETKEIHKEMVGTIHSLGRACQRADGSLVIFGAMGDVLAYLETFAERSLAPWHNTERDAIIALGGEVEPEETEVSDDQPSVIIALGSDKLFRKVFWKLGKMGGMPLAKFDTIPAALDYLGKRKVHSIVLDVNIDLHEGARLIRQIRTTPAFRKVGIFIVGPTSKKTTGKAFIQEGADGFIPFKFSGEEIFAMFDRKAFFHHLKLAYEKFEVKRKAT